MAIYAVNVVWNDGSEEYLKQGDSPARFMTRKKANEASEFLRMGIEGECQSINIVPYPALAKAEGRDA